MSNSVRYRYGDTNPVAVPLDVGTAFNIGDMMFTDSADSYKAKPAGSYVWDTDLATTQTSFALVFLGVSSQYYDGTTLAIGIKDSLVRVNTEGVYDFDCASSTFVAGELVGPAKQSGDLLEPQKVVSVATEALAIGRVVKAETSAVTTVRVRVFGKRMLVSA